VRVNPDPTLRFIGFCLMVVGCVQIAIGLTLLLR
jgi:uncharacterized protein YjeT (DUF2065 family)